MALETLKDVIAIDGFAVIHGVPADEEGHVAWKDFYAKRKECPIFIDHNTNLISFRVQNGPIEEVGVNGCQVDTMIEAARLIIEKFDESHPCEENTMTLMHLRSALSWLDTRKKNREARGVEGTSNI